MHAGVAGTFGAFLDDRLPFAAADVDRLALDDWLADLVADFLVTRFRAGAISRVALFAIAGLVARLADVVADCLVARLIDRLADRVALVAIAGLRDGDLDLVLFRAEAGLRHWLTDRVRLDPVARLMDRLLDLITLGPVLRLVDVPRTGDRHLVAHGVADRPVLRDLALIVDNFLNRLVTRATTLHRRAEVTAGCTGGCRAAIVAGSSAVAGHRGLLSTCQEQARQGDQFRCNSHLSDSSRISLSQAATAADASAVICNSM